MPLLVDNEGKATGKPDQEYLELLKSFFASQKRSTWMVQHDSPLTTEILRLLTDNIGYDQVKKLTIKLQDDSLKRQFVWEDKGKKSQFNSKASEVTIHMASPFMVEFSYLVGIVFYMTAIFFLLRMCYSCAPREREVMP